MIGERVVRWSSGAIRVQNLGGAVFQYTEGGLDVWLWRRRWFLIVMAVAIHDFFWAGFQQCSDSLHRDSEVFQIPAAITSEAVPFSAAEAEATSRSSEAAVAARAAVDMNLARSS